MFNLTYNILEQFRLWAELAEERKDMKSEKSMGHFNGWQFGVPVKIIGRDTSDLPNHFSEARLVDEGERYFTAVYDNHSVARLAKSRFRYELIPYNREGMTNKSSRYPVCITPLKGVYCNAYNSIANLGITSHLLEVIPEPTATLIINGKEIQLSAETVARLKKELGV